MWRKRWLAPGRKSHDPYIAAILAALTQRAALDRELRQLADSRRKGEPKQ